MTQHQGMLYETGLPSRQLCLPRSLGRGDATGGGDRRRPITVAHVYARNEPCSFHVTSFFRISQGRLVTLDECWGDDDPPPRWRQEMGLSTPMEKVGAM